jgi:TP901 family phage tail tape measure protein
MRPALNFSKIAMMDAAEAGLILDDITDVYGGTLAKSGERVDKIAWSMREFGVSGQQVAQMLQMTAPSAQLVNASFEDMLMATSMVASVIPNAGKAAQSVQMAFMQLASEPVQKKLQAMGLKVQDDNKKFLGLEAVLSGVIEKTKGLGEAEKATTLRTLFGGRAAGGMAVIFDKLEKGITTTTGEVLKGADAMRYLNAQMGLSSGMSGKMAADMVSAGDRIKAQTARLKESFGDAATQLQKPMKTFMADIIGRLADAFTALPPTAKNILVGIGAGLGTILVTTGSMIVFSTVLTNLGFTLKGFLLTSIKTIAIVAPLALAFTGLAIGIVAVMQASSKGGKDAVSVVDKLKVGWQGMVDLIGTGKLSEATEKELGGAGMEGVRGFLTWFEGVVTKIGVFWTGLSAGWTKGVAKLEPALKKMSAAYGGIFDMFFGKPGETPADELARWGVAGDRAGQSLASLGTVIIDMLTAAAPMMKQFSTWLTGLSAADIEFFVKDAVAAMKTMISVMQTLASGVRIVKQAFMSLFYIGATIVAAVSETLMNIYYMLKGIVNFFNFAQTQEEGLIASDTISQNINFSGTTKMLEGLASNLFNGGADLPAAAAAGPSDYRKMQDSLSYSRAPVAGMDKASMISEARNIKSWMGQSTSEFNGGATGIQKSWEQTDATHQARFMVRLEELSAAIEALSKKPLVATVNYATVGEAADRANEDSGGRGLQSTGTW